MKTRIEKWYEAQKEGRILPCPRCGGEMDSELAHNAFSRREEIYVCDKCGMNEAIEDSCNAVNPEFVKLPTSDWYMNLIDKREMS